ncbi:hypothetical protein [uncultured Serinicoccus sp.]|uniref:hypothetical protein n=1 Tax=uncultured Serinicoccus sp. TaxID=735514 RepID=UPI00262B5638|nr:hypothetical protein [uncultured Serinicoccus sp.]
MRSEVIRATWLYAALVVLGVLWVVVDDHVASRATASGLVGGASAALLLTRPPEMLEPDGPPRPLRG